METVRPSNQTDSGNPPRRARNQPPSEPRADRRGVVLVAANRALKQAIVRHESIEKALRKSDDDCQALLKESRRVQKHLQQLTHRVLSAQEVQRKKMSHDLQDEIAQTLLGINVRLLTLKKEASVNAKDFKKDIASTQRLVEESIESISRFVREIEAPIHTKRAAFTVSRAA